MRLKRVIQSVLTIAIVLSTGVSICYAADYQFSINTEKDTNHISLYVYGSNGFNNRSDANMTCMRQGGNRLTGYNWENNASNAGSDWYHSSDGYLSNSLIPAKAATDFIDNCRTNKQFPVITLQMAGYVAADKKGTVDTLQTAPSSRWKEVIFSKGSPYLLNPDTADGKVYLDEFVNFLAVKYSKIFPDGICIYSLDNEPGLWENTHPRIHPVKATCKELIQKSAALAKAVKSVDPGALIAGGVFYGYMDFASFDDAPDWKDVKQNYDWFISWYLDEMRKASEKENMRLLDILDLHWYPEAQGDGKRIISDAAPDTDDPLTPGALMARMQAPRSLWDTSYVETSWISKWMTPKEPVINPGNPTPGPIKLIPHVMKSINTYFPGTKVSITEFTYGAPSHISGGIATADFLGITGKCGIFMTNKWFTISGFSAAAYKIFRNYDGNKGSFGNTSCSATTNDYDSTSVYSSFDMHNNKMILHAIAINKASATKKVMFEITSSKKFITADVWGFDAHDSTITKRIPVNTIKNNTFEYSVSALSVLHFVVYEEGISIKFPKKPSPFFDAFTIQGKNIHYTLKNNASITILDIHGKVIKEANCPAGSGNVALVDIPCGAYLCITRDLLKEQILRFTLLE